MAALFLEIGMLFQDGSGHLAHVMIDEPRRTFRFGSVPNWNMDVTHFNPNLPFREIQALNVLFTSTIY